MRHVRSTASLVSSQKSLSPPLHSHAPPPHTLIHTDSRNRPLHAVTFRYIPLQTAQSFQDLPQPLCPALGPWGRDHMISQPAPCRRWRSNPSGKCSQARLTRGTVTSATRRVAHPSGCAGCGADACSAIKYQFLCVISVREPGREGLLETRKVRISHVG